MDGLYQGELTAVNAAATEWSGELYEESYNNLSDGPIEFRFEATWNNGAVDNDIEIITIDGNWDDYFRIHRIK